MLQEKKAKKELKLSNGFQFLLVFALIIFITIILPIKTVRALTPLEEELGVQLGEGAGAIATVIKRELDNNTDLVVYETSAAGEISFLVFVDIRKDIQKIAVYQVPLRTQLDKDTAARMVEIMNGSPVEKYVMANLGHFIEVIDAYGGVNVETEKGNKWLDSKMALEYMELKEGEDEFARLQRQEEILWAMETQIGDPDSSVSYPRLITALYRGVRRVETNMSLLEIIRYALYAVRYGFIDVTIPKTVRADSKFIKLKKLPDTIKDKVLVTVFNDGLEAEQGLVMRKQLK